MTVSTETIENWIDSGEDPSKILHAVEQLPPDQLTEKLALYYGQCLNLAGILDGSREKIRKACNMLVSFTVSANSPELYFQTALSLYLLELKGAALRNLKIMECLEPGGWRAALIRERCLQFASEPVFSVPASRRFREAWESFSGPARTFQELSRQASPAQQYFMQQHLYSTVRDMLTEAMGEFHFDISFDTAQPEITLRCSGYPWLLYASCRFIRSMPPELHSGWTFTAGTARGQVQMSSNFNLTSIIRSGVQVWADSADCGRVLLEFWYPGLGPFYDLDILWALAAYALGEAASLILVEDVYGLPKPRPQGGIPLEGLAQELLNRGYRLPADSWELAESFLLRWERTPAPGREHLLREDICLCTSRFPALEQQFLRGEYWELDELTKAGASAGFLFFPAPENLSDAMKQGEAFSASLLETAGADCIQMLGVSAGTRRVYVDFIAWDLEPVLKAGSACFSRSGCQWGCYHSFFPEGKCLVLWGMPDRIPESPCVTDTPRPARGAPQVRARPRPAPEPAADTGTARTESGTEPKSDSPQTAAPARRKKQNRKKKKGR